MELEENSVARKRRQRVVPTLAKLWFRGQEQTLRSRDARQPRKHAYAWVEETIKQQAPETHAETVSEILGPFNRSFLRPVFSILTGTAAETLTTPLDPTLNAGIDRSRVTGIELNDSDADLAPAPLRRILTRPTKVRLESGPPQTQRKVRPIPVQRFEAGLGNQREAELPIESARNQRSTLDEFEHFLMSGRGKNRTFDPLQPLFQLIHDDSKNPMDIICTSMQRIREGTLVGDFMQKRVRFWRSLLHRLGLEFEQFIFDPDLKAAGIDPRSKTLCLETQRMLRGCMDLIDRSSHSLLAEMQTADSRRGIAEAESVSKLTEVAFVFIPLSFVASLFSMQVHELDGGVPIYRFALVAIAIVIAAYAVRLSIRSECLLEYRDDFMHKVHKDSGLKPDEKLPIHKLIAWAEANVGSTLWKNSKNTAAVFAPFLQSVAVIVAAVSPIALLWQRKIDVGFSVAITVLILLLDGIMILLMSNADIVEFNPRGRIRRIQEAHERNGKRRQQEKRRRRREAGGDSEAPYEESSVDTDAGLTRKIVSLTSV